MTADHPSIIEMLRGTPDERQKAIRILITDQRLQSDITTYILNQKGHKDEAMTIFHDSIICFAKKVFTEKVFDVQVSHSAYIFGIAKNLWFMFLRSEKRNPLHQSIENNEAAENSNDDVTQYLFSKDKIKILHEILSQLPTSCKDVLLYWAGGYSMTEIAEKLGYKTEGVARKKKFYCFKSLVDWLQLHPSTLNELKSV